jgi:hypothetical protein
MTKHRQQHGPVRPEATFGRQPLTQIARQDMTPGRACAEGSDIKSPSHERWEQRTAERDPAEGADY